MLISYIVCLFCRVIIGVEVNDCMMITDDDMLFFSNGEAFIPPKFTRRNSNQGNEPTPFVCYLIDLPPTNEHVDTFPSPVGLNEYGENDNEGEGNGTGANGQHRKNSNARDNARRGSMTSLGPFLIGEVLGKGGFGEVRVGVNQLNGEKVALKFLRKSEIMSLVAAERTATEIQCLSALKHPNIIQLVMHMVSFHSRSRSSLLCLTDGQWTLIYDLL